MNTPDRIEAGSTAPATTRPAGGGPSRRSRLGARLAIGAGVVAVPLGIALAVAWPRPDPDALWRQAQADLQAGRFDEAERASDRLARLRTPTEADRMLRAQIAIARDRIDEAIAMLEQFPEGGALSPQAVLLIGQLELRRDRMRLAERAFERALELDPGLAQARRELIYIHGYRSEAEAIDAQFRRLAEVAPLSPDDAFLWSLSRGVQWTPEEVAERLGPAVAADPDDLRSRIALADALMELNRFDEAEEILAPVDPSEPDSRAALGRLAMEVGDVDRLRSLLADAPEDHAGLAMLRGQLALQARDPEAAVTAYRTALGLMPNDRDALSGLAQALNQAGRRDEAAEILDRQNRVNVLNNLLNDFTKVGVARGPEQFLQVGAACEAIGLDAQARAWYQVVLSIDPFHRGAQEALGRLGERSPSGPGSV